MSAYFQTKQSSKKLLSITQDGAVTNCFRILKEHIDILLNQSFRKVMDFPLKISGAI